MNTRAWAKRSILGLGVCALAMLGACGDETVDVDSDSNGATSTNNTTSTNVGTTSTNNGGTTSTNSGTTSTNNATTSTNNATTSTNNATTSTNNATTSTNNATTSTNNSTTSTNNGTTSTNNGTTGTNNGTVACTDATVYEDIDDDGYGVDDVSQEVCLEPGEEVDGFASVADDCGPDDPWRNPGAEEICGDNLDDDCDGEDADCPTTQAAGLDIPEWDCAPGSTPPQNVFAWARFEGDPDERLEPGCFVVFEGLEDEFYTRKIGLEPAQPCDAGGIHGGCVCPSLNGWASYDRRLYAFTLAGAPDDCAQISLRDHQGEAQVVSNACRKYLYQMYFYDLGYAYLGSDVADVERRLTLYPTVEIACAEDAPHANLPFASLLTAEITRNPDFVKK